MLIVKWMAFIIYCSCYCIWQGIVNIASTNEWMIIGEWWMPQYINGTYYMNSIQWIEEHSLNTIQLLIVYIITIMWRIHWITQATINMIYIVNLASYNEWMSFTGWSPLHLSGRLPHWSAGWGHDHNLFVILNSTQN